MKLDPKRELQALLAIQELGEATANELSEHLSKEFKSDIDEKELNRYLRRLRAKKLLTANKVGNSTAYKTADVPSLPMTDMPRVKMNLTTMSPDDANKVLEEWIEKSIGVPKLPTLNKFRNFHRFNITFKTLDPILGDRVDENGGEGGVFPRLSTGELFIPPSWWRGWFRANLYMLNIPETIAKFRMGFSSEPIAKGIKTKKVQALTQKGPRIYEAIPEGTLIKVGIRFPLVGLPISKPEQFEAFIKEVALEPQRGMGSNPFYYGGRLEVVKFEDRGLVAQNLLSGGNPPA